MRLQITPICGGRKVELRETRRAVTPFGGLVVFGEFLGKIGYAEAVRKHLPFRLTSPNAIDPVQTFTAFLLSVLAGARRFAHTGLLRADQPCSRCWGFDGSLPTIPSATGSSVLGRDRITDSTRRCGPGRWSGCRSGKGATAWIWIPRYLNATDDKRER